MSLDGELEVAVYIRNFHNLDLFQQGWYSVKVMCYWETENLPRRMGIPSRVVQYAAPDAKDGEAHTFWKIDDIDNSYHSRPFRIRYSRQDVALQEMVSFKLFVSQQRPMEHGVIVDFDLMFAALDSQESMTSPPETMPSVAHHAFRIEGGAWAGLHTFCPVTFDSWHFVYVEANVHSVLLSFSKSLLLPTRETTDKGNVDNLNPLKNSAPTQHGNNLSSPTSHGTVYGSSTEAAEKQLEAEREGGNTISGEEVSNFNLLLRTPTVDDLKLLRLLVASREKLSTELQVLSSFTDETAFSIPQFSGSAIAERLERSVRASSDYAPPVNSINYMEHRKNGSIGDKDSEDCSAVEVAESPEDSLMVSIEEWLTEREELTSHLAVLWNIFLNLHRLHQSRICQLLRERWEASRPSEATRWVVGIEQCMEEDEIFGMSGSDWAEQWRSPKSTLAQKQQEERPLFSATRADLYRTKLNHAKCLNIPFQDMQYYRNPAAQPIMFGERHEAALKGMLPVTVPSPRTEGMTMSQMDSDSDGNVSTLARGKSFSRKREEKHVVVFVHGFQGHHLDLRLLRNHWMIMDPQIECFMSDVNEEKTFDGFSQMGQRLADEVSGHLTNMFSTKIHPSRRSKLKKLSFVGHSIGNLIIRAAIADDVMKPYLPYLHTFLSVCGPHLGYLYSSNNLFNGGLWLLKRFKGAQVMHQLTFTDRTDIRDCYLYQLSQMSTFEHFQHVILLSSPQDRYVPYHSARIEMCPAAMRDQKKGGAFAAMVHGCLSPLLQRAASVKRTFLRVDVNFDVSAQANTINNLIGRTAHIEFLETDVYIRFLLWYYRDCFV